MRQVWAVGEKTDKTLQLFVTKEERAQLVCHVQVVVGCVSFAFIRCRWFSQAKHSDSQLAQSSNWAAQICMSTLEQDSLKVDPTALKQSSEVCSFTAIEDHKHSWNTKVTINWDWSLCMHLEL